jgi:hypothetical protein
VAGLLDCLSPVARQIDEVADVCCIVADVLFTDHAAFVLSSISRRRRRAIEWSCGCVMADDVVRFRVGAEMLHAACCSTRGNLPIELKQQRRRHSTYCRC